MITPDNHILVSAIQSINPDAKFSLSSIDDIRWHDGTDPISKESIEAEIKKITPTISGYYFISVWFGFSEDLSDGKILQSALGRNGQYSSMDGNLVSYHRSRWGNGTNIYWEMSGTVNLDANDYVSAHVWHNQGDARRVNSGRFSAFYLGENL